MALQTQALRRTAQERGLLFYTNGMSEQKLTREFSICLLPTENVATDIETIRNSLPDSPYRDDIPHITLLRGITAHTDLSDDALAQALESILSPEDNLPLEGNVVGIANKSNQFYSSTGLLLLEASPRLTDFRKQVADRLKRHNYDVEAQELANFMPHITIRLGIALEGASLHDAEELFRDRSITFSDWLLFRLIEEGDKRIMHQVWPYSI